MLHVVVICFPHPPSTLDIGVCREAVCVHTAVPLLVADTWNSGGRGVLDLDLLDPARSMNSTEVPYLKVQGTTIDLVDLRTKLRSTHLSLYSINFRYQTTSSL
jgi:hypothetical protein